MAQQAKLPPITRLGLMAYAVAAVVVVLDQASKAWVLGPLDLQDRLRIPVLPIFSLDYVENPGVSFGLLTSHGAGRWLLVAFAACVVSALALWVRQMTRPLTALAIGLVMGG